MRGNADHINSNTDNFYAVPESPNENTGSVVIQTITERLDINITEVDLDRSHGVGKQSTNQNKSRPIIINLIKYSIRRSIFHIKKKLKGKKISITKSFTKIRMGALKNHSKNLGFAMSSRLTDV